MEGFNDELLDLLTVVLIVAKYTQSSHQVLVYIIDFCERKYSTH